MVVERDQIIFRGIGRVNYGIPRIMFKVDGDCCHLVQKEVIGHQNLHVGHRSKQVHGTFWQEYAIVVIVTGLCSKPREEFAKELGILWCAFNANDVGGDFCGVAAMGNSHSVQLEIWKNRNILIPIQHRLDLHLFEVRCPGDCGFGIEFDKQQLIH